MKEIDRRTFFRVGAALAAGAVVAEVALPLKRKAEDLVEKTTGRPAGNAYLNHKIEDACKDSSNQTECVQNYEFSTFDKVYGIGIVPAIEEMAWRAIPSHILSQKEHREDPFGDVVFGTGSFGLTRRELIFGAITSILSGISHNVISYKEIDTKTTPASQTVGEMIYWYLQRKLGIASNLGAHSWNNFRKLP